MEFRFQASGRVVTGVKGEGPSEKKEPKVASSQDKLGGQIFIYIVTQILDTCSLTLDSFSPCWPSWKKFVDCQRNVWLNFGFCIRVLKYLNNMRVTVIKSQSIGFPFWRSSDELTLASMVVGLNQFRADICTNICFDIQTFSLSLAFLLCFQNHIKL